MRTVSQFLRSSALHSGGGADASARVLRQFPDSSRIHLVFSAHGLPMSLVEKGDPYPNQIEATVRLVCEEGSEAVSRLAENAPAVLPEQRRTGQVAPTASDRHHRTARHEGVKEMLVVPISFVTEHIETLHEINIEASRRSQEIWRGSFRMMPAVGDSPLFIAALKDLVLRAVGLVRRPAARSTLSSTA